MTSRVNGGSLGRNPFGPTYPKGDGRAETSTSVGRQVEERLFAQDRPELLEPDEETAALLARLDTFRKKLARLAGDDEADYRLQLVATAMASINAEGTIFVGRAFLLETAHDLDIQVGVLAHEIGHRPQRWDAYRAEAPLDAEGLNDLCRLEETRADYFAGYAVAQLGRPCEPLCAYLHEVQTHPHPAYFTPALRAKTIREGHEAGRRRQVNLQKFFPELARNASASSDLGNA